MTLLEKYFVDQGREGKVNRRLKCKLCEGDRSTISGKPYANHYRHLARAHPEQYRELQEKRKLLNSNVHDVQQGKARKSDAKQQEMAVLMTVKNEYEIEDAEDSRLKDPSSFTMTTENDSACNHHCNGSDATKVVLVTGGSRGIGESCVRLFVQNGWSAVFCAPKGDESEGMMLEDELNNVHGYSSWFVICDVTIETEVTNLIECCIAKYGRLDCVINSAGWHPPMKTIDEFTSAEFTALFNLNVLGTFLVIKYSIPYLRCTRGNVVNIASIVGCIGQERAVTYVATKGAVKAMTKALAIDEAPHGVRINCVSPGNIATPLLSSFASATSGTSEEFLKDLCNSQHIRRLGTSDEVAKACLFLAVEATFSTGSNLLVSGGAELGYGAKP